MTLTVPELDRIIQERTFEDLVGTFETSWVEHKGEPYQLSSDAAKRELAKDVSSFANADGGRILIGIRTQKSLTHLGDEVERIRPFSEGHVNTTQYIDVIASWIVPAIEGLRVEWVGTSAEPLKGIVVITVPRQKAASKPFLIVRILEGDKSVETLAGYAERKGASNKPLSISDLQVALRYGLNFDTELRGRFDALESLVREGLASKEANEPAISNDELGKRIAESTGHGGLAAKRHLVFVAVPEPLSELRTIFSNQEGSLKRHLERPPSLRRAGWDLTHDGRGTIVRGEYVRVSSGDDKVVDVYRDGVMILVALANHDLLGWGQKEERLNPLALMELTYSFVSFYSFLLADSERRPRRISFRVLLRHMRLHGLSTSLSPGAVGTISQRYGMGARSAPADQGDRAIVQLAEEFDPLTATHSLAREIYLWFGLNEDNIPYLTERDGKSIFDVDAVTSQR